MLDLRTIFSIALITAGITVGALALVEWLIKKFGR
jgi:hypothetical protein